MNISSAGLDHIKAFEGLRCEAYRCTGGVWTVGYGHTGPGVREGSTVSEHDAIALLEEDVSKFEACVNRCVHVLITQSMFDALVSFAFNFGCKAFADSTMLRKLNQGDKAGAADEFTKWVYSGGRITQGLVRRREVEREMFLKEHNSGEEIAYV